MSVSFVPSNDLRNRTVAAAGRTSGQGSKRRIGYGAAVLFSVVVWSALAVMLAVFL